MLLDSDTTRQITISVPCNEDVNLNDFIDDYFGIGHMAILIAGYDKNFKKKIIFDMWSDKLVFYKGQIIYVYISPLNLISQRLTYKTLSVNYLTMNLTYDKEDKRPFIYDYINLYTCLDSHSNYSYYRTWGHSISYGWRRAYGRLLPCVDFLSSERLVGIVTACGTKYIIARVEANNEGVTSIENKAERDNFPDRFAGFNFRSIYQNNIELKGD